MKKFLSLSIVCLLAGALTAQNIQPLTIGTKLPDGDTKMKAVDGKTYSIMDAMGKNGVLVMFSCNTCPYVVKYQSRTLEAIKNAKEKGYGVIIINSNQAYRANEDSYTAMQAYAKSQGYNNAPYVVDENSAMANAFGATRTPECFLFNASGLLIFHGAMDDNQNLADAKRNHILEAMNENNMNKEVSVKEFRSVGCTIKRN